MGFEDVPKKPVGDDIDAKRVAMAKMADSAVKSEGRVRLEDQISGMASHLETVSGNDWAEFRSLVNDLDMTDEETQAVGETIAMLQSMRPEFSDERRKATLESLARRSKIIEVATAQKVFDRLPDHNWDDNKKSLILSTATRLMEALSYVSSEQDTAEAVERRGLIISKDEVQEAIERGKNLNIV